MSPANELPGPLAIALKNSSPSIIKSHPTVRLILPEKLEPALAARSSKKSADRINIEPPTDTLTSPVKIAFSVSARRSNAWCHSDTLPPTSTLMDPVKFIKR